MTIAAEGNQACTVTTEHTLNGSAFTTAGAYICHLDFATSVDGATPDIFEIRVYNTVRSSGGTERLKDFFTIVGAQSLINFQTPPYREEVSIKFTIKQTQGAAGRTIPWRIDRM